MRLSDIILELGEPSFHKLIRTVSIGKLKTFQLYDRVKLRFHLNKLNSETLRKASPKLWSRVAEHDEEFTTDIAQVVLVSNLEMIRDVLDLLGIPHEDGFFAKDLDVAGKLTEGWQQRVIDAFREKHPESLLVFYVNHLDWELTKSETIFQPQPIASQA
jgi:hypothetical protein